MKLTGDPKKEVKNAQSKEEAKEINRDTIEEAGTALDDEELDKASGGAVFYPYSPGSQPK